METLFLNRTGLPKVAIIADDITGALDASAPFALRGLRTIVAANQKNLTKALRTEPQVIAVSTNSREMTPDDALAATLGVTAALKGVECLFKKVDSRLKGHVGVETTALAKSRNLSSVLLCPSIPDIGRIVMNGQIHGPGISQPLDVRSMVKSSDIPFHYADASSEKDLDVLIEGAISRGDQLLSGARGLADALSRHFIGCATRTINKPELLLPLAVAIGSRDPITLEQVVALRAARPDVPVLAAPNGAFSDEVPEADVVILQATEGALPADPNAVERLFAASFVPALSKERQTLILTGGSTAAAILEHMGIGLLHLLSEVAPGIPVSQAIDTATPLQIVTKSGGFGAESILLDLIEQTISR